MSQQYKGPPESSDAEKMRGHVALKGFFNICREWGCTSEQMLQMLGGISRSTLARYKKFPYIKLSRDKLERISYILGIYKSIRELYPTPQRANRRIRLETNELPFSGTSALDFMAKGSMKHMMEVRRYFDAKKAFA